jgi:hypothetical protein
MPQMPEALATVPVDEQHHRTATYPTTPGLLTPRRKPAALLHFLRNLLASWTKPRVSESRWIRPDQPRWETPAELLARKHTYLYIRSLLG